MADHLTASANQEFKVELESHPTSGAMWQYRKSGDEPALIHEELKPVSDSIGSPAIQRFTFLASKPGTFNLTFELKREWEPTFRDRKQITVIVQ
jgi:predicted secreted protein